MTEGINLNKTMNENESKIQRMNKGLMKKLMNALCYLPILFPGLMKVKFFCLKKVRHVW